MRITKIETIRINDPVGEAWYAPKGILWVQVYTDKGIVGLGETWYAPSIVEAAIHDWFGPLLIGRDAFAIERHWTDAFRLSDHAGYGGAEQRAISALDMALWDIKGQAAGVPVYELLGGAVRKKIRVYATGAPHVGAGELAKQHLDKGITAMKMGPTISMAGAWDGHYLHPKDLDRALQPLRDVRDAVGMQIQIANDGHGKWSLPIAIQIAQAMEPYEIMWQEDLMPLMNADSLAILQANTKSPVCISERLLSRWQFRQFIENGSARVVMPDLIWTGGISETWKIATLASAHQAPVAPHDATGPVNIFACAQICMACPSAMIMEHVRPYFEGWYAKYVDPNLDIRDGFLHAPQRPGIGTRLRPEVRDMPDVLVKVSDTPGTSGVDHFEEYSLRSPRLAADFEWAHQLRKAQAHAGGAAEPVGRTKKGGRRVSK